MYSWHAWMQTVHGRLKPRARRFKAEAFALYLAARDPRTPWYARLLVAGIVAYALSPIDLIPDFVPVLGYLDDLILVPLGIALALKLVPRHVIEDCRMRAEEAMNEGRETCEPDGRRRHRRTLAGVDDARHRVGLFDTSVAIPGSPQLHKSIRCQRQPAAPGPVDTGKPIP